MLIIAKNSHPSVKQLGLEKKRAARAEKLAAILPSIDLDQQPGLRGADRACGAPYEASTSLCHSDLRPPSCPLCWRPQSLAARRCMPGIAAPSRR